MMGVQRMFKLVEAWLEEAKVEAEIRRSGMGLVDLQIVGDALARDRALTDPEGVKEMGHSIFPLSSIYFS
jgi:hypothetical protein